MTSDTSIIGTVKHFDTKLNPFTITVRFSDELKSLDL